MVETASPKPDPVGVPDGPDGPEDDPAASADVPVVGAESPADAPPPGGPVEVTLYFSESGSSADCNSVRAIRRTVEPEADLPTMVVRLLLAGPTAAEARGDKVWSPFVRAADSHVHDDDLSAYLERVVIEGGIAFVDFDDRRALDYLVASEACRREAMEAGLARTLGELPGVTAVRYRVNGRLVDTEEGGA